MTRITWIAGMTLLATMRSSAHHAFAAEYDEKTVVAVSGTVTSLKWTNPHAWLYIEGKDETGNVASWSFEMGSPNGLVSRGWKREELKNGDQITVDGYLSKKRRNVANARTVTLPDGRKLFGGFQSTPRAPVK
jgi:hypothetical protein